MSVQMQVREIQRRLEILEGEIRQQRTQPVRYASSSGGSQSCPLVWEISIAGNPTTGLVEWDVTIDGDTQTIQIEWDDTAADVKSEFTSAFSAVDSDDITAGGGPNPDVGIYLEFNGDVEPDWPPIQGTTTLDNSAHVKIRKNSE